MVHVKILIEVKEYERLQQIEKECQAAKRLNKGRASLAMEQKGGGNVDDTAIRNCIKEELARLVNNLQNTEKLSEQEGDGKTNWRQMIREEMSRMLAPPSSNELNSSSLVTPTAEPLPPNTLPTLSNAIVLEETASEPQTTTSHDPVMEPPNYTEDDNTWYYLGSI